MPSNKTHQNIPFLPYCSLMRAESRLIRLTSCFSWQLNLTEVESRTQGSRPRPRTQKKFECQGQGQPFRGQTLSRPRTGMLEAKAKDQGHKRKCSPKKKKGLHKNFSSDLHKKTFSKKFFNRSTKF